MIIAQTQFELRSTTIYSNRLIAYNSLEDIPINEIPFNYIPLNLNEKEKEKALELFGWSYDANLNRMKLKMARTAEVIPNQKLSYITLYWTNSNGWITYRDAKKVLKEVIKKEEN